VLAILIVGVTLLGVGTLNDLSLALFVGMLVGTFSSIFIATPYLCQMKERTPENIALANRVKARRKGSDAGSDIKLEVTVGAPIVSSAGPRQQRVKKTRSGRSGK
jgi:preprotein translocase subunit SecF